MGDRYYPGPTVALVLAYLDAPSEVRKRDRAEWAAVMATHVEASAIRDAVDPLVYALFDKHSKKFRSKPG